MSWRLLPISKSRWAHLVFDSSLFFCFHCDHLLQWQIKKSPHQRAYLQCKKYIKKGKGTPSLKWPSCIDGEMWHWNNKIQSGLPQNPYAANFRIFWSLSKEILLRAAAMRISLAYTYTAAAQRARGGKGSSSWHLLAWLFYNVLWADIENKGTERQRLQPLGIPTVLLARSD